MLVLAADAQDFSEPAWLGFARTLAVQFGQTIALGQSLTRGAASEARYRASWSRPTTPSCSSTTRGIVEANRQAEVAARPAAGRDRGPALRGVRGPRRARSAAAPAVFGGGQPRGSTDQHLRARRRLHGSGGRLGVAGADRRRDARRAHPARHHRAQARRAAARRRARSSTASSSTATRTRCGSTTPRPWPSWPSTTPRCGMYGYSREEFLGMTDRGHPPAGGRPPRSWNSIGARARALSTAGRSTVRHRKKDGVARRGRGRVEPARSSAAGPRAWSWPHDVTEKRQAGGAAPAGAEDGGGGPPGRRRRPRLQQPARGHHRLRRAAAARPSSRAPRPRHARADPEGGRARGRPHPAAPGLQPQAGPAARGPRPERTSWPSVEKMLRRLIGEDIELVAKPARGPRAASAPTAGRSSRSS